MEKELSVKQLQKIGEEVHAMGLTGFTYWFEFRERLAALAEKPRCYACGGELPCDFCPPERPQLSAEQVRALAEKWFLLAKEGGTCVEGEPIPSKEALLEQRKTYVNCGDQLLVLLTGKAEKVSPRYEHSLLTCLWDLSDVWQAITGDSPADKCMRNCGIALGDVLDMHATPQSHNGCSVCGKLIPSGCVLCDTCPSDAPTTDAPAAPPVIQAEPAKASLKRTKGSD